MLMLLNTLNSSSGVHRPPEGQGRNGITRAQSRTREGGITIHNSRFTIHDFITIYCHVGFSICKFFYLFIFFTHTQHNIQIQQNKTTDTYSTSQGPIKREGEREGQQEHKSHSFIQSRMSNKKHCQASMVEGLAPPTRAVVHSHDTICRRLRIQYVFLHMCGVN